jgi:hypothetical protein
MLRVVGCLLADSLVVCVAASAAIGGAAPRQHLTVSEDNYRLSAGAPEAARGLCHDHRAD